MKPAKFMPGMEDRQIELEEQLDAKVSAIIAEADDAGYAPDETLDALDEVVVNQRIIASKEPE